MPPHIKASFLAQIEDEFQVFPENWDALKIFLAMQTQWNCGMGGPIGLRYEVLPVIEKITGIVMSIENFDTLRKMEQYALEYWAECRKEK